MKQFKLFFSWTMIASIAFVCSCSDEATSLVSHNESSSLEEGETTAIPEFVAELTPAQMENLKDSNSVFLMTQQQDSWNTLIDKEVPTRWGVFSSLTQKSTRAAGIWGSYPAQYWSMIRVKTGTLSRFIRDGLNNAVEEIESNTNVRFYNSQKDPEYYEPYHIKYPNIFVRYADNNEVDGTGSFGLVGGEQYINVPRSLENQADSVVTRFFLHALCNAAGMFNEQQRKDRDDFVTINWDNIKDNCKPLFDKQNNNYIMNGSFDFYSITLASSYSFSKNGNKTIQRKGSEASIALQYHLSPLDIYFLNEHYLPYIARTDNYIELDDYVYNHGRLLTEDERKELQDYLNSQRGLSGEPPAEGRIERTPW